MLLIDFDPCPPPNFEPPTPNFDKNSRQRRVVNLKKKEEEGEKGKREKREVGERRERERDTQNKNNKK